MKLIGMAEIKNIRILLAEEDSLVREELINSLKFLGYRKIELVTDAEKAIEAAGTKKNDLILLDNKMTGIDGIEVARRIKLVMAIPIVVMINHESKDYIEQAANTCVDAYISKSSKPEEIERAFVIALARYRDILLREGLIRELEGNRQRLNEAIVTKDKFFKIIAHDLKNPVFGIQGLIELLDQNFNEYSSDTKKELIHAIKNAADKIGDLLSNLLNWAKTQDGSIKYEPERINLLDSVKTAIRPLESIAKGKKIQIDIQVKAGCVVYADLFMLTTILRNLISNAIKFTKSQGVIRINSRLTGNFVKIYIKDNGIGMSKETIQRLLRLEEGFSTSGTAGEAGSGLGLILCKEFIELNKGTLFIESVINKGSNFMFTIPII
jgi:two-component system, sensor histidine kinase and response regulator